MVTLATRRNGRTQVNKHQSVVVIETHQSVLLVLIVSLWIVTNDEHFSKNIHYLRKYVFIIYWQLCLVTETRKNNIDKKGGLIVKKISRGSGQELCRSIYFQLKVTKWMLSPCRNAIISVYQLRKSEICLIPLSMNTILSKRT